MWEMTAEELAQCLPITRAIYHLCLEKHPIPNEVYKKQDAGNLSTFMII